MVFAKAARAQTSDDPESWVESDTAPTLNAFDTGDVRSTALVAQPDVGAYHERDRVYGSEAPSLDAHAHTPTDAPMVWSDSSESPESDLLPAGLDSHRYRCCGNGVVAPVADWLGRRIAQALSADA